MNKITFFVAVLLTVLLVSCSNNNTSNVTSNNKDDDTVAVVVEKIITDDELKDLSISELRIKRNEIFAKLGYIFKSDELKSYFSQFDWYSPKYDNVDDKLTEIDKENIELIKKYENLLNENKSDFQSFLTLFDKIDEKIFDININHLSNFSHNIISYQYAEMFLDADTTNNIEGMFHFEDTTIAQFNIPNSNNIGLITKSTSYSVYPNTYEVVKLWVFAPNGNLIGKIDIASYEACCSEEWLVSSVFENEGFTKKEIKNSELPGGDIETEIKNYKITFEPITSKIIETET